MKAEFVFGYGSLVNTGTHEYGTAHPARLSGWRRAWRHTDLRPVAFLTAVPDPETRIDGAVLAVRHDEPGLGQREYAYERYVVSAAVVHELPQPAPVQLFAIAPERHGRPTTDHPILLSYIDVVVQGYLRAFGHDGVRDFFATTDGWNAPVLDDRDQPRYPRHQKLSAREQATVDDWLSTVSARVFKPA